MKLSSIAGGVVITVLVLFAVGAGFVFLLHSRQMVAELNDELSPNRSVDTSGTTPDGSGSPRVPVSTAGGANPSVARPDYYKQFLYGRVTTTANVIYEGRLRFGGREEAFWSDYFNGVKEENTWVAEVAPERRRKVRQPISILGLTIAHRDRELDYGRLYMERFGDIAHIETQEKDVRVTLKSGSSVVLNGFSFGDFDDGIRVWDTQRGVVDVDGGQLRAIELLPTPPLTDLPSRLHGTVRSAHGEFTGFIQWDREECLGDDLLSGIEGQTKRDVRFDTIRSIEKLEHTGSLVTTLDGASVVLSGTNDVNDDNRGIYVDDVRYGRVLVPWRSFERVDFTPGENGPGYGDFPPGSRITGRVTTRSGKTLAGRLVYDLDESETTHTFDGPYKGVDYSIPFGLIEAVVPPVPGGLPWTPGESTPSRDESLKHERIGELPPTEFGVLILWSGEELKLERSGDFGDWNAGMLVFANGADHPEYVPWSEIARVDLERPAATFPPIASR